MTDMMTKLSVVTHFAVAGRSDFVTTTGLALSSRLSQTVQMKGRAV